MPTGVALRDGPQRLFAAAERVLVRDGPSGLTSRAVTDEAGVAKGVLHRHFGDFDSFLCELIADRVAQLAADTSTLHAVAGQGTVVGNLVGALRQIFTPTAVQMVALFTSRDRLRTRLRESTPRGLPILTQATTALTAYLETERALGRLATGADPAALAFTLIGTGHMLFAGEPGGEPDPRAVAEIVESILVGSEPETGH